MKSVITHAAAAVSSGLLVFLVLPPRPKSAPARPEPALSPHSRPGALSAASDFLAHSEGKPRPDQGFDRAAYQAFLRHIEARVPTRGQLIDYLASRNRDPEALLAASLMTEDLDWLQEAVAKAPDNPHILFAAACMDSVSPDERLAWTKRLRKMQPDNALVSYLLAVRFFEADEPDAALKALKHSLDQPELEDFSGRTLLVTQEAYRATGSAPLGAKILSTWRLPTSHATDVATLAARIEPLLETLPAGESQELRALVASIGTRFGRYSPSRSLLTELVGLHLQQCSLSGLSDDAPPSFDGPPIAEARASIENRREEIRNSKFPGPRVWRELPLETIEKYLDRSRLLGEFAANRWLLDEIAALSDN